MLQGTYRKPLTTSANGSVRFRLVRTQDGTAIGLDAASGMAESRPTPEAAGAELMRLAGCRPPPGG